MRKGGRKLAFGNETYYKRGTGGGRGDVWMWTVDVGPEMGRWRKM